MGATFKGHKYAKDVIDIDKIGTSAPAEEIMKEYGFALENIIERFKSF